MQQGNPKFAGGLWLSHEGRAVPMVVDCSHMMQAWHEPTEDGSIFILESANASWVITDNARPCNMHHAQSEIASFQGG